MIGKVERVALRNVWNNEARDFTVWLAENLDAISEELDIPMTLVETEKSVGTFNVDVLAVDNYGNYVVIENQLEKTDHDHLGKVLTYTTNLDAKTAIWISSNPRKEHIEAISWLNEYTPVNFYLLKIEAIKIGESKPAPLFSIVSEPNEESKKIGEKKIELTQSNMRRKEFWEQLLERSQEKTTLFANIKPGVGSWLSIGVGLSGMQLNYIIRSDAGGLEVYIDKGKESDDINKARFDYLFERKDEIESSVGETLEWSRNDEKRASAIRWKYPIGLNEIERHEELQDHMIDFMIKFEKELKKHISALRKIN